MIDQHRHSLAGQYLTFSLREEDYAVEIGKVREVLGLSTLTKIPRMPDFLSGVINLRGNVVPVMDLGLRLGLSPIAKTISTSIVIVEVVGRESTVVIGAITDCLKMVVDFHSEDIEKVPAMGGNLAPKVIKGIGKINGKFHIILDIDKVMAPDNQALLKNLETVTTPVGSQVAASG